LALAALLSTALFAAPAWADKFTDTVQAFKKAEASGKFFAHAHGYAVFPTIGKGGVGVGGAYGKGRVYEKGRYIGDTSMTQLSIGFQLGAQGFSQIVFFENEQALKTFTQGEYEFGAEASAVAITAGASAKAGTTGVSANANVEGDKAAKVVGLYNNGMAIFTLVKGGVMYEATVSGQKFKFKKR
jgi:lipid-binding SYLF domain-containing protein